VCSLYFDLKTNALLAKSNIINGLLNLFMSMFRSVF
jgi:hypothetical protein